ncbi:hypothetical protein [Pandoraea commovens]|uniref:Uncharacterized protein n=1 Tax=Pandoraea commovens TaxID=2508289 RepID=A0ABY5QIG1_9BURK|nr:hypothetical protein [Pandoraea commovens]UVA80449.1 hypothetical protein NTU39_05340 [Pandoraea commovens]
MRAILSRLEAIHPDIPLWIGAIFFTVIAPGLAGYAAPPFEFLAGLVK